MTRKDFELIAATLKAAMQAEAKADDVAAIRRAGQAMARAIGQTHPKFDMARFLAAAGVL